VIVTATRDGERPVEIRREALTIAALDVIRAVGEVEASRPAVQLQLEVA
jgi:hypothetical protein